MKKTNISKEKIKNRFSLTIIFALVVFFVLALSIAIFITATFIISKLGFLNPNKVNSPDFSTLFVGVGLISLTIGFAVTMFTLKIPLKPFNMLITQMNRLAQGDFKARLNFNKPIATHPAFKEISDSFNKMAEELEGSQLLRSDFINNISHEFKTPIVSIAGFAKLLQRGNLTEEQKAEYISIIEEESLRLSHVATNVLNLTKVENQSILTDISSYNLSEQLRSSVLLLESKWTEKDLNLSLDFDEITINANEELLKQVWINLIDNAIKFSPQNETVEIEARESNGNIIVHIRNSGYIEEENKDKIFARFYQTDESHSKEGNGVGLAIVKRIIELHNGKISVNCENEIVEFTIQLSKQQNIQA